MNEGEPPVEVKKRNAQHLYAKGFISLEDYDVLGRHHGFVSADPEVKPPGAPLARVRQAASVAGLVLLALTATAEIVSRFHPELRGPLETLLQIGSIVVGGQ